MPVVPQSFANLHFVLDKGCNILLAKNHKYMLPFFLKEYLKLLCTNLKFVILHRKYEIIINLLKTEIMQFCQIAKKSSSFIYALKIKLSVAMEWSEESGSCCGGCIVECATET